MPRKIPLSCPLLHEKLSWTDADTFHWWTRLCQAKRSYQSAYSALGQWSVQKRIKPKTVRNAYGLLSASLEMFHPDFRLKVTLPARKKAELYTPSDEDIRRLLNHIQGTELEIAVYLAAFGPMRRGEICALESTDIHGSQITVSKSMVIGPDQLWHIKQPKTYSSYRTIDFPDFVIQRLSGINGRIVKCSPNAITSRFTRL